MEIMYVNIDEQKTFEYPISICLGLFDGIHLGHQEIFKQSIKSKFKSAVLNLDVSSGLFLKREGILTSIDDKISILSNLGIDYLFILKIDEKIKNMSCEEFIEKVLKKLNVKEIIVGRDYRFGKNKKGDVTTLLNYYDSFYDLVVLDDVFVNGERVSSTLIATLIKKGDMKNANLYLGRKYMITGIVEHGLHNGSKIGFPTMNVRLSSNYILPKDGVYAVEVKIDNKMYLGMANIGIHPTISPLEKSILEINIFDFENDLYNKNIDVYFIDMIREEIKFSSLNELKKQLIKDRELIKQKNEMKG